MAQRESGYARIGDDHYATPSWVVDALLNVVYLPPPIWEVAPGAGHIVGALEKAGKAVVWQEGDFFAQDPLPGFCASIVTNPPFRQADKFIIRSLELTRKQLGKVAMLLPVTFDCARSRRGMFGCYPFAGKYVLTRRIRWENIEQKKNGPSTNHAWYVWDWNGPLVEKPFIWWV